MDDLPRKLKKREASITPDVMRWFENNYPKSVALEVKIKGGKIKPHQEAALNQVAKGRFSYKIPDMGRRNCFDAFVLIQADPFLVTCDKGVCEAINKKTNETFSFEIKKNRK